MNDDDCDFVFSFMGFQTVNTSGIVLFVRRRLTVFLTILVSLGFAVGLADKVTGNLDKISSQRHYHRVDLVEPCHPVHFIKGELIYNEKEKSYQCVLCLYEQDLLKSLKCFADVDHVWIDKPKTCEPILKSYIEEEFQLKDGKGKLVPFQWVGYEADIEGVWVYFEYAMEKPPKGMTIENYLLTDADPTISSFLVTKWGWRRQFLTFGPQRHKQKITFKFKQLDNLQKQQFRHKHVKENQGKKTVWPIHDAPPKPDPLFELKYLRQLK